MTGNPLDEPLRKLVGDRTAKVLGEHLDLHTTGDLLHHYPRRYAERGELTRLADLPVDEYVTVVAQISKADKRTYGGGSGVRLEVVVSDGSGTLTLVFFSKAAHAHAHRLIPGRRGMFSGKVSVFNRTRQLAHPDYQLLDADDAGEAAVDAFANRLIPLYPACKQITSWKIAQAVETALNSLEGTGWEGVGEPLPDQLRETRALASLPDALEKVHRPRSKADIAAARDRLRWDEAFVLQVALARRRAAESALPAVPRRPAADGLLAAFDAKLPFTLTEGQETVSAEVFADLATDHPMHRLLQGEVGSGKTLVALRAMLGVVDSRRAGRDARADRGSRAAAPPLHHRDDGRARRVRGHARRLGSGHQGGAADRLDGHRRPCGRRCWTW